MREGRSGRRVREEKGGLGAIFLKSFEGTLPFFKKKNGGAPQERKRGEMGGWPSGVNPQRGGGKKKIQRD